MVVQTFLVPTNAIELSRLIEGLSSMKGTLLDVDNCAAGEGLRIYVLDQGRLPFSSLLAL